MLTENQITGYNTPKNVTGTGREYLSQKTALLSKDCAANSNFAFTGGDISAQNLSPLATFLVQA